MEKTETRTQEPRERELKEIMGGAMIPVQVELFEPFVKFAKEYLAFFGSKDSFEIFCMKLVYDGINRLHRELTTFVEDKAHMLDGSTWFDKHQHLGIVSDQPEDEE
jgi:hypothetical protein